MKIAAKGPEDRTRLLPNVLNGGIGGIVGVACVFPIDLVKVHRNLNFLDLDLDVVKVRLQNQKVGVDGTMMYKGLVDCIRKTYRSEVIICSMHEDCSQSLFYFVPQENITIKLARLAYTYEY